MTDVLIYSHRFPNERLAECVLCLLKTTDWFKLLQLPNVTWLQFLVAVASLVVVIWAILRLVSRVNEDVDPAEADREMLQALNDLRLGGDLSEDEFRLIKGQITSRLNTSWKATGSSQTPAKNAAKGISGALSSLALEVNRERNSESNDLRPEASQSNQSETVASATNVPMPSPDPDHLAQRLMPLETENGVGKTEAGRIEKAE